jgi:hypothetical protein
MSRSWAGGSTRWWRQVRADVLARDRAQGWGCRAHEEGWCERAGAKPHVCLARGEVGHHTLGRSVTGDDPRHVVSSCAVCNLAIGDPTAGRDPDPTPRTKW